MYNVRIGIDKDTLRQQSKNIQTIHNGKQIILR